MSDSAASNVRHLREAALAAAIDYKLWIREVSTGQRDVLS